MKVWVNAQGEELKVFNTDPAALQALRQCGFGPQDEEEPQARRVREPDDDDLDEDPDERPVRRRRPARKKVG
jgi:hypothetical protein